jgi:nicotinate dehydrogenase subunit B
MLSDRHVVDVFGARLSRRNFLKAGGSLAVGIALVRGVSAFAAPAPPKTALDPTLGSSWIEINADNTILIRTGKPDFGQGTPYTAYRQIVAEELYTTFEAITTVVEGHTDGTPDGSGAFNFLSGGLPNIRKAAAYTFQALRDIAARHFAVSKDQLSAREGIFILGHKSISYGELVRGQKLSLKIPVSGDLFSKSGLYVTGSPPLKPVSEYTVIGRSFPNSMIAAKVSAKQAWTADVRLPGMLHARIIHPKTLGSTLVSAGTVDGSSFPNTQVVVKGNRVAVVAPDEWEAIQASYQVASATVWTEWKGLPRSRDVFKHLRGADWSTTPEANGGRNRGEVGAALAGAARTLKATYETSYIKHAPMGPAVALADFRPDGYLTLYASSQNPQSLRAQMALMLGCDVNKVVVRGLPGAGQFGRSNGGNGGAEDDAVILSQMLGKPVRVQWMRDGDMQWSPQSAASFADIEIALDADGRISAYAADHHMPALNDDRPVGAVLAGLPTMAAPSPNRETNPFTSTTNPIQDPWIYDKAPAVRERGRGTFVVGEKASPTTIGLRSKSLRTPGQLQQNFARELAMSEAAALAGADSIQFRLDHVSEPRMIGVLNAVRDASGWQTRPSPAPDAVKDGIAHGRGVSAITRHGADWACICDIAVALRTGKISVLRYTVAVDAGIVINPQQIKRQIEGGAVMGISQALLEETTFDESGVMSLNWGSYPILTMADLPEINVVLVSRPNATTYNGASEAANALACPAIASALLDATGKTERRLPLKPSSVLALLKRSAATISPATAG